MPDYNSASVRRSAGTKKHYGRTIFLGFITLVIIAAAVVVVGGYIYFTYLTPANKFIRAFDAADYETCQQISAENAFDESFISSIQSSVITASENTFNSYKTGVLSGEDATAQLQQFNTLSDNRFEEQINAKINEIASIEQVHTSFNGAKDSFVSGNYLDGIDKLMQVSADASAYGVSLESDIASVITDYKFNIKNVLFTQFATYIRRGNYDAINNYIDFVTSYTEDSDLTGYKETVASVQAKTLSSYRASRTATTLAKQAASDAQAQPA
jgi:hypothetical protein